MTKLSEDLKAAFTHTYLTCVAVASEAEVAAFLNAQELEIDYEGYDYTSLMDAYLVFQRGIDFANKQNNLYTNAIGAQ